MYNVNEVDNVSSKKEPKLYKTFRPVLTFLFKILYRPKIVGRENIKKRGRLILAGNHTNNLDAVLLISSTNRCIHFLAKKELCSGIKRIIFTNVGLIPVNRKIKDHNVLIKAREYILDEKLIGIFPEGTIEKEKNVFLPFKIGAVKLASDTDCDIVPFYISGDYKLFSSNLKIVFGEPIKIDNKDLDKENAKLISNIKVLANK